MQDNQYVQVEGAPMTSVEPYHVMPAETLVPRAIERI